MRTDPEVTNELPVEYFSDCSERLDYLKMSAVDQAIDLMRCFSGITLRPFVEGVKSQRVIAKPVRKINQKAGKDDCETSNVGKCVRNEVVAGLYETRR